jgi:DNA-binding HxlR family transcriptional regulator
LRCRKCEPVPEDFLRAASLLERRWLLSILYAAQEGALRFNEFRYALGQISPRTLAQRLVELEDEGLLERRIYDSRPPRAEYVLTEHGRRLGVVVDALRRVAEESRSA